MPELPEVETMRRGILAAVGGKISTVEKIRCRKKPIEIRPTLPTIRRKIVGKKIVDIDRIGKRVVIHIGSTGNSPKSKREFLVFEPRMTGLVLVVDPPTDEHLRFRLRLSESPVDEIMFWDRRGLGNVSLYSYAQMMDRLGPEKIGPDALRISLKEFIGNFNNLRRPIKVALLDQKLVAGVGNLYAAELLHTAGIHPQRLCCELRPVEYRKIHQQMKLILEKAILYEGSTLSDGTYRNALNQDGGYQNQHRVYDRAGNKCPTCRRGVIKRIVQSQRATFYCPRCQK